MAYISKNKADSRRLITALGLNSVPEKFFDKNDAGGIREFFKNNKSSLYVLRDAEYSSSKYEYVKTAEECVEKAKDFSGKVIVAVSINAFKNKLLLGAIEVAGDTVRICATENSKLDHRTMYSDAEYNFTANLFDKKLNKIPEFDFLIGYIYQNQLFNITVEFTIYDRPVGTNQERILINELRNY